MYDFFRGRRLRNSATLRTMVRETRLNTADFIMPYFVADTADKNFQKEISSMPGQYQLSLSKLEERVAKAIDTGLQSCLLFGIPKSKDATGTQGYAENGIVQRAVGALKKRFPQLVIITDVCLCEYTSHGHCGLVTDAGEVRNDPTLELLSKVALSHANAGADIVAPSDMMDGRIAALRCSLDEHGYEQLPIMSYAVKYASAYYGPFREAAESAPQFGDRKTYQMDYCNSREALREAEADVLEGADFLMVKPAGAYLDIIRLLRENFNLPLAAYQVSGEYSQIMAAAANGWLDKDAVTLESLIAIKRAGADLILSYFTEYVLEKGLVR